MNLTTVRVMVESGPVLAALDQAESLDIRERRVALDFLDEILGKFRA